MGPRDASGTMTVADVFDDFFFFPLVVVVVVVVVVVQTLLSLFDLVPRA